MDIYIYNTYSIGTLLNIFLQCIRDFKHKTESETHAHPGGRRNLGEWTTEQVARQIQLRKRRYRYRCSYRYGYRARLMDFTRRSRASEMMAILAHTLSSDIASLCGSLISQIGHSIPFHYHRPDIVHDDLLEKGPK